MMDVENNPHLPYYAQLLRQWNEKLNLVSRKEIEHIEARHIAPCAAFAKVERLKPGSTLLDIGTGGGLPGLALAILFPETEFTLIDSVGKKINAVASMAEELGLVNVSTVHGRVENLKKTDTFNYVTGRAVTAPIDFAKWAKPRLKKNGTLYYWSGGDIHPKLKKHVVKTHALSPLCGHTAETKEYFETKYILKIKF